uniref:Uncharacterized protein n=1 Tax=Ascaris lumbricoides TaxID=6252 RepID=A0A9J2PMD8_ASCLU
MFSSHEGQKRGLLRLMFRNLPLFGFLTGLVIFFYVFYIYQAQNAELTLMREEYSILQQHLSKLKTENVGYDFLADMKASLESCKDNEKLLQGEKSDTSKKLEGFFFMSNYMQCFQCLFGISSDFLADMKASLESCKDNEKLLQGEKSDTSKKLEECSSNLRSEKMRAESQKLEVAKVETEKAECSRRLESAHSELLRLNGTMAAIHAVGVDNQALVITLNSTVNQLRAELARLKTEGHAESAVHFANELIQEASPKAKMHSPIVPQILALGKGDHDKETVKENAQALPADEKRAALLLPHVRGDDAKVTVALSTTQSNAGAQPHPLVKMAAGRQNRVEARHLGVICIEDSWNVKGEGPTSPTGVAKVDDALDMDRPAGPGDRVKLEDRRNQQDEDDGRLVMPGGEYANSLEQGTFARHSNEAAPDFENSEKKVNEREV